MQHRFLQDFVLFDKSVNTDPTNTFFIRFFNLEKTNNVSFIEGTPLDLDIYLKEFK
jgi:hypothetical protein